MARNRLVHSIASSLSRVSISAQPPTSSFASENGPSSTVNSPSAYLTLVASSTGPRPPVARRAGRLPLVSAGADRLARLRRLRGCVGAPRLATADGRDAAHGRRQRSWPPGGARRGSCLAVGPRLAGCWLDGRGRRSPLDHARVPH